MTAGLGVNAMVVLLTVLTVGAAVGLHYEGLSLLARRLAHGRGDRRRRVLYAVLGALALHIMEVWLFALAYLAAMALPDAGGIAGAQDPLLFEAAYLSAMTFSTVGFGDVAPFGAIRFIAGTEAVVGLLLIGWSATFTYFEMERNWRDR
jgi:hypothetical protein